jgi:AraC family transcriptional regulator
MKNIGAYGRKLGEAFRVGEAPAFVTRSLFNTEIAVTQIKCDLVDNELTTPVPREDAFLVKVQICDLPKRELWMDGKPMQAAPLKAGAMAIFDLRRTWVGKRLAPLHAVSFYLPRRALDSIADLEGVSRIDHFDLDPAVGVHDATIASLGSSLLASFERPEEANQLFVDHITSAAAAHVLCTYGVGKRLSKQLSAALAPWQEQRAKELLMASIDGDISVARLAGECGLSITGFNRAFGLSTGLTPHQWLLEHRVQKAMSLLRGSTISVDEVASACGFVDKRHFVRVFTRTVGTNPRAWQRAIKH